MFSGTEMFINPGGMGLFDDFDRIIHGLIVFCRKGHHFLARKVACRLLDGELISRSGETCWPWWVLQLNSIGSGAVVQVRIIGQTDGEMNPQ
jgi:hypothetical protein